MDTLNSVKSTFSSWDSCMSKAYCKWPVVAGIIIGSLILLSVIFCVARCICCGAECACCCFRCCAGCCGGRDKKHKHLDPIPPTPYGAAAGPGLPMYNQPQYQSAPPPVYHNPYGQTATFESTPKVHEDSLPAMPSWENASSRKVEVIEEQKAESHELEKLNPQGYASPVSPNLPGFAAPQPVRPSHLPQEPYTETDSFLGAHNGQSSGVLHADSHSGYRGISPSPGQIGYGYAAANTQRGYQSSGTVLASRDNFQTQQGFQSYGGGGQGYNDRPGYDRQYSDHDRHGYGQNQGTGRFYSGNDQNRNPVSPVYSGSTAYDHDQRGPSGGYQAYRSPSSPAYGNQQVRKPVNGTWKDV